MLASRPTSTLRSERRGGQTAHPHQRPAGRRLHLFVQNVPRSGETSGCRQPEVIALSPHHVRIPSAKSAASTFTAAGIAFRHSSRRAGWGVEQFGMTFGRRAAFQKKRRSSLLYWPLGEPFLQPPSLHRLVPDGVRREISSSDLFVHELNTGHPPSFISYEIHLALSIRHRH